MTSKLLCLSLIAIGIAQFGSFSRAQEVDGTDLGREAQQRQERFNKLSTDEQLKLRAAQKMAAEDPTVQEAMKKRNKAVEEFRAAVRASMLKADPTLEPILNKIRNSDVPNK